MLDVFISDGEQSQDPLWLANHPPWREELLSPFLEEFASPGALLIDPFAQHAAVLRVAQAAKCRVLATNFDPLPLLQLRLTHSPPEPRWLDSVFSRLADTPRHGTTLSRHLDNLYVVLCSRCARAVPADHVIWEGDTPVEKGFHCPSCGEAGSAPVTARDLDLQASAAVRDVTYWRLHQRLVRPEETADALKRAEGLLELYTPRSRTALGELILQAETLFVGDTDALDVIRGLCLACLQRCHSLHRTPDQSGLPRSLHRPQRFVERNVWRTFESAYRKMRSLPRGPSLHWAPDLAALLKPASSGLALTLQLASRDLRLALEDHPRVPFICLDPPRLDTVGAALSYLWSGWLFGREAGAALQSLTSQGSEDHAWYMEAMTTVLRLLNGLLTDGGRLLMAYTSADEELMPALILAAARSGLVLDESIHQVQDAPPFGTLIAYRMLFRRPHRPTHPLPGTLDQGPRPLQDLAMDLHEEALDAAKIALGVRGEAASCAWLQLPIYTRWSREESLRAVPLTGRDPDFEPLTWLQQQVQSALPASGPDPSGLRRARPPSGVAGQEQATRPCWWRTEATDVEPLSERVERFALRLLQDSLTWPQAALHDQICRMAGGFSTPDRSLLQACIESYAQEVGPSYWQLRPEDWPTSRAEAHQQTIQVLVRLGRRLGFDVWLASQERQRLANTEARASRDAAWDSEDRSDWEGCTVIWHEKGIPDYGFALSDTAALSPWTGSPVAPLILVPRYLVVPGGRAGLLAYKLHCWPDYQHLLDENGWLIVKQRRLRNLADIDDLDRATWRTRIRLDPITDRLDIQLDLF